MKLKQSTFSQLAGIILLALCLGIILAACAPAAVPTMSPAPASPAVHAPTEAPAAPAATQAPAAQPTTPSEVLQTPIPAATPGQQAGPESREARVIELEWPAQMKLGNSDVIRLSLLPSADGYTVTTEFPGHQVLNRDLQVKRPAGYDLQAAARLEGVAFEILPVEDQVSSLPIGEEVTWHWTLRPLHSGQQRLSIRLALRWIPLDGQTAPSPETLVYSKGMDIQVASFLGMSVNQALAFGWIGTIVGGCASIYGLAFKRRKMAEKIQVAEPDEQVEVEPRGNLRLDEGVFPYLRALFRGYQRLFIENEFQSGYSGARTLLILPIRKDGRTDAHTIVKLGSRLAVEREYASYEQFVKDSLPPMTARIQHPPIRLSHGDRAAVRYTFIGKPGSSPASLRQALLENPDPGLLRQLFETFGPNWWLQRRPYTFRLAQEYDRLLPAHLSIEPASGKGTVLDSRLGPGAVDLKVGERVTLQGFEHFRVRADGSSVSISGLRSPAGQPPLRLRASGLDWKNGSTGRIFATRSDLLRGWSEGFQRPDLPDPIECLPGLLEETVNGTRSIIHGDLNLENILVGPGALLWLIDFAETREGHPLFDFAHLEAEIIAHVLAPRGISNEAYLVLLQSDGDPLLRALHEISHACLFNPNNPRESSLARYAACLGALKHPNLTLGARQLLYLTAAWTVKELV